MSARYLIVDCHSIIFQWPDLRQMHGRKSSAAREELVKLLTAYQDYSGVRVVAVFDGQGARVNEDTQPGGIQVFYAGSGDTADDVIERLVAKYGQQHDITVATDDLMEQQTVISFGGGCISSDGLRGLLQDTDQQMRSALRKMKKQR